MKTIDDFFRDWESDTFGFGYGTGETYIIPKLRAFLHACKPDGTYDYVQLQRVVGDTQAWLFINVLCRVGVIEYGVSPRYGWLTECGKKLREYVLSKPPHELTNIVCLEPDDYVPCGPEHCNCSLPSGKHCNNPFWRIRR